MSLICVSSLLAFMSSEIETESIIMYMCAAALLGVYVCAHAFVHHLKLACKIPCKGTSQEQTNYKLCAKVSITYIIHCGRTQMDSTTPVWINIVLIKHKMWWLCLCRSLFSRHCHLRNHFSALLAI